MMIRIPMIMPMMTVMMIMGLLILLIRLRLPANSASVMKSFITDSFCWLVLSMHEVPDEDLLLVYGVYVSFAK